MFSFMNKYHSCLISIKHLQSVVQVGVSWSNGQSKRAHVEPNQLDSREGGQVGLKTYKKSIPTLTLKCYSMKSIKVPRSGLSLVGASMKRRQLSMFDGRFNRLLLRILKLLRISQVVLDRAQFSVFYFDDFFKFYLLLMLVLGVLVKLIFISRQLIYN